MKKTLISLVAVAVFFSTFPKAEAANSDVPDNYQSFRDQQDQQFSKLTEKELQTIKAENSADLQDPGSGLAKTADSENINANVNANAAGNQVFGYVPYWMGNVWDSFRWSSLDTVAWFKIVVDYKGDLVSSPTYDPPADLISKAHANGVDVVLTVTSVDTSSTNTLIFSPTDYNKAADNIVAEVMRVGADGVNIDFELLDASNKARFTDFNQVVTTKMHAAKSGSQVTSALPAIDWSDAYDIAGIATGTDGIVIMGYDYFGSWSSEAGPVSPLYDPHWRSNYSLQDTVDTYFGSSVS